MREHIPLIMVWTCVAITAIAAYTDYRSARIPNWLTMPAIIAGPLVWWWVGGMRAFNTEPLLASAVGSLISAVVCGGVLYFGLYRTRINNDHAVGAGDIKLFAALGSLGLIRFGIESMFYAVCVGVVFTVMRLAWRGVLLSTLANAAFILINPVLPKKMRREINKENLTKIRFGVSIFIGTLFSTLSTPGHRPF